MSCSPLLRIIEQEREELLGETTRGRDGNRGRGRRNGQPLVGASDEGKDLIKEMAAATIHNISLKRAVLGPGILTCLLSLAKGTPPSPPPQPCHTYLINSSCHEHQMSTYPINAPLPSPLFSSATFAYHDLCRRMQNHSCVALCACDGQRQSEHEGQDDVGQRDTPHPRAGGCHEEWV